MVNLTDRRKISKILKEPIYSVEQIDWMINHARENGSLSKEITNYVKENNLAVNLKAIGFKTTKYGVNLYVPKSNLTKILEGLDISHQVTLNDLSDAAKDYNWPI